MYFPFFTPWLRRRRARAARPDPAHHEDARTEIDALEMLTVVVMIGLIGTVWYSFQFGRGSWIRISSIALGVAGAALLVGGLLGFLFGIPRTLQHNADESLTQSSVRNQNGRLSYRPNTNLEQISDWLTKILVGVGLTQITALRSAFIRSTETVSAAIDPGAKNSSFASAILIFFSVTGFLLGFLWTRLSLIGLMYRADSMIELERRVTNVEEEREIDALALTYTDRILNPASDMPPVDPRQLKNAIMNASPAMKVEIFKRAADLRRESWKTDQARSRIQRVIPIFEALAESDRDERFHRNHGQLGYALKDLPQPDWERAFAELSRAIEIRDRQGETLYRLYEVNRGLCRIHLDPAFSANKPSSAATRQAIIDDLKAGVMERPHIIHSEDLQKWIKLNHVAIEELRVQ